MTRAIPPLHRFRHVMTFTVAMSVASACDRALDTGSYPTAGPSDAAGIGAPPSMAPDGPEASTPGLPTDGGSSPSDAAERRADARPAGPVLAIIDDMESTQFDSLNTGAFLSPALGKLGNWFISSATAPLRDSLPDNIVPPRGTSTRARRVQGSGLKDGIDLWAQLDHPTNAPVNLSNYSGIAFWARLTGGNQTLLVAVQDAATTATSPPHNVFRGEMNGSPWFVQKVAVSDQWQRIVLLFDDFRQGLSPTGTTTRTLDTAAVTSIDFITGLNGSTFDLWIDDLALLCRGECSRSP